MDTHILTHFVEVALLQSTFYWFWYLSHWFRFGNSHDTHRILNTDMNVLSPITRRDRVSSLTWTCTAWADIGLNPSPCIDKKNRVYFNLFYRRAVAAKLPSGSWAEADPNGKWRYVTSPGPPLRNVDTLAIRWLWTGDLSGWSLLCLRPR